MYNIAAISDFNYLIFGLSLRDSVAENTESDFTIHYLALDDESESFLQGIDNIKVYPLSVLKDDPMFDVLVKNNPPKSGDPKDRAEYQWALGSFFTHYLIHKENIGGCLYVDSDICFYSDIKDVFDCVHGYDVGLITHKHLPLDYLQGPGFYNVGIVYFSSSTRSMDCLSFWRRVSADRTNEYFNEFGTCGDQKYLELFESVIEGLSVKNLDECIGQAAPWNFPLSEIDDNNILTWDAGMSIYGKQENTGEHRIQQKLMLVHFSHFRCDFEKDTWSFQFNNEWGNILPQPGVERIYNEYFDRCKNTKQKYNIKAT